MMLPARFRFQFTACEQKRCQYNFQMSKSESIDQKDTARDNFSQNTKELLARRAGYRCSICQDPTVGPHSEPTRSMFLGEASHIYSAAPNGPRANLALKPEERVSPNNGIHLCKVHARQIDIDVAAFPVERLFQLKTDHESKIRALIVGNNFEYDAEFLNSHETQIIHGRGKPSLNDLRIDRVVIQSQSGTNSVKKNPLELISSESGVALIAGDQSSGRTSLLKQIAVTALSKRNCVWLNGRQLTESLIKDPISGLAAGYKLINSDVDGWQRFLEATPQENLIIIDDFHLSNLNIATRRKFLALIQGLSSLVFATVNDAFLIEILAFSGNDNLKLSQWRLLELTRANCYKIAELWCKFGAESIPDHDLDSRIATAQEQLELVLGKKLMPRQPLFVFTALQMIDAGSPMDSHMGSFGGVYETVINFAIWRNTRNQAQISNERSYLQELAYWIELSGKEKGRDEFNLWFSNYKDITPKRASELEFAVQSKGFLSLHHSGFRYNYQKYYFLACFLRDNPGRLGVKDYLAKLISECWIEDYANTVVFLAYLQPSSILIDALLLEVKNLFSSYQEFKFEGWKIASPFPPGFFKGISFSSDPEKNRQVLAERLDEQSPVESSECFESNPDISNLSDNQSFLDLLKSFHLIKIIGQLIRNSPIAFDAQQKHDLIKCGFDLSLRIITITESVCSPAALQMQGLNELRERTLKNTDRIELETKLIGIIHNLFIFLTFAPLKYACSFLAHPELLLTYRRIFQLDNPKAVNLAYSLLACGLDFELRTPDSHMLHKTYRKLTPAGKDILHLWVSTFLSYNRVPVSKKQAILDSVDMASSKQLLLDKGLD